MEMLVCGEKLAANSEKFEYSSLNNPLSKTINSAFKLFMYSLFLVKI